MSKSEVATLLAIDKNDARLKIIYENSQKRLLAYLKVFDKEQDYIPKTLDWVIDEVTIARFNRIGSEGMTQKSLGDQNMTFDMDEFRPYDRVILAVMGQDSLRQRGKVRYH